MFRSSNGMYRASAPDAKSKPSAPPPLPGPSPAARAAAEKAAAGERGTNEPPPLPANPSPPVRAAWLAATAPGVSPGEQEDTACSARIVITGESSGIRLGVIMLDTKQKNPEFCCQCGVRDAAGRVYGGKLYCRPCWELLEDMAVLKQSAASESVGLRTIAGGAREERCVDCGKPDKGGAVDESDGNFYCCACWALTADIGYAADGSRGHAREDGSPTGERCECARVHFYVGFFMLKAVCLHGRTQNSCKHPMHRSQHISKSSMLSLSLSLSRARALSLSLSYTQVPLISVKVANRGTAFSRPFNEPFGQSGTRCALFDPETGNSTSARAHTHTHTHTHTSPHSLSLSHTHSALF